MKCGIGKWWQKYIKYYVIICLLLNYKDIYAQLKLVPIDSITISTNDYDTPSLILSGELHGVSSNTKVEEVFQLELILKHNVRTIIIEEPYTNSYLINKFISTGDTTFLNMYVGDYPQKFKEIRDRVIRLYEINKSQNADNKIKVLAFDVWENIDTPFVRNLFQFIVSHEVSNQELRKKIENEIMLYKFPNNIKEIDSLKGLYNVNDYSEHFVKILKSYLFYFTNKDKIYINRQEYLYKNLLTLQKEFKGNIYGNLGYGHIDLNQKCTAFLLNSDTSFKYKITSYYPYYHNCISLPWIPIKRNEGYKRYHFKRLLKKIKPTNGVYYTEYKGKKYIIHVGQIGMSELK